MSVLALAPPVTAPVVFCNVRAAQTVAERLDGRWVCAACGADLKVVT